eukprot:g1400.t1
MMKTSVCAALLLCAVAMTAAEARVIEAPTMPATWKVVDMDAGVVMEKDMEAILSLKHADDLAVAKVKRAALANARLTMAQHAAIVAPAAETVDAVMTFLRQNNLKGEVRHDSISVRGKRSTFAKVFSTSFSMLVNVATGQRKVRAADIVIPESISWALRAVHGFHGLPLPPRSPIISSAEVAQVTPSVLRQVYKVSGVQPTGRLDNRQAVGEFQGQTFNPSDLTNFFEQFVPFSKNASDSKIFKTVGSNSGRQSGVEAALDVEYIMGTAPSILTEFWGYEGQNFCLDLKQFTTEILSQAQPPSVFSISYGWQGSLSQLGCQDDQVKDVDDAFASIAARGISVIISSGDSGSAAMQTGGHESCPDAQIGKVFTGESTEIRSEGGGAGDCCSAAKDKGYKSYSYIRGGFLQPSKCYGFSSTNGTTDNSKAQSGNVPDAPTSDWKLYSSWPASSPWVTAVGATRFIDQDPSGKSGEMSTDQFGSGGGLSFRFNQSPNATWQASAVAAYLQADANDLPPNGSFPVNGRATPDVSALGEGFQVIANGETQSVGGTSASAPTFAGIISLLNEARMQAGKPALGFLNKWIYENPTMFSDVVKGSNKISRAGMPLQYGWQALKGWDGCTGLGTPDFSKMLENAQRAD